MNAKNKTAALAAPGKSMNGSGSEVSIKTKVEWNGALVAASMRTAARRAVSRSAAFVMAAARNEIKIAKDPSQPGRPPHSRAGQLKHAIRFAVGPERGPFTGITAVVGPTASEMGEAVAGAHEHGLELRGRRYPSRPFMGPVVERCSPYVAARFENILCGNG